MRKQTSRCGVACLVKTTRDRLMMSGKMYRFRPHPDALDPRFLSYFIGEHETQQRIDKMKTGISDSGLNLTHGRFALLPVRLPPLNEQRRIVDKIEAMFERIDKGVENLRAARTTLALYRQSLLKLEDPKTLLARSEFERDEWHRTAFEEWSEEIAGWQTDGSKGPKPRRPEGYKPSAPLTELETSVLPVIPKEWIYLRLNDVAWVGSGMSVSKARKFDDPVEVPYLRVANVQRGFLDLSEIKTMPIERSQVTALALSKWDVLFNEGGDLDKLGRGWVWEAQVPHCITQNHVFRGTPFRHDLTWSKFISQWGNSYGRNYFETGGKQTTNLASINKTVLKALPVPYCSPAEQTEITRILDARLDAADKMETEIDAALARADALRQSILKRAFAGDLVPQDPTDEPAPALLARIKAERAAAAKTAKSPKPAKRKTKA